jgi:hypothetical protein
MQRDEENFRLNVERPISASNVPIASSFSSDALSFYKFIAHSSTTTTDTQKQINVEAGERIISQDWITYGTALFELGNWVQAHEVCREGLRLITSTPSTTSKNNLQEIVTKLDAYVSFQCDQGTQFSSDSKASYSISLNDFYVIPLLPSHTQATPETTTRQRHNITSDYLYLSKQPIISPDEAATAISFAEEYADIHGGWSTDRHYAVPTTDIPVHTVPKLLQWFNHLLEKKIFPSLASQFFWSSTATIGTCSNTSSGDVVGKLKKGPKRISIHDAFIVKYQGDEEIEDNVEAHSQNFIKKMKQRSLPLHRDQSTHSFILPLNHLGNYTGGGTFFADLDRLDALHL